MSKHISYPKLQKAYWYLNHLQKVEKKRKIKQLAFMLLPFTIIVGAYLGIQFKDLYQLNHIKLSETITAVVTEPEAKAEVLFAMTEEFIETRCEDELIVEENETFVALEEENETFYGEVIETIEPAVEVHQALVIVEKAVVSKAIPLAEHIEIEEVPIIETNQIKSIDISKFAQTTKLEHTLAIAPKVAAIKAINIHQMVEVGLEDADEIADLEGELEQITEAEEE